MNDLARRTLCELILNEGSHLAEEPRRCEGLLRDLCVGCRREIHALVGALREGVAADLREDRRRMPMELLLPQLTSRLQQEMGLAEDVARWTVESWALALGAAREEDLLQNGAPSATGASPGTGAPPDPSSHRTGDSAVDPEIPTLRAPGTTPVARPLRAPSPPPLSTPASSQPPAVSAPPVPTQPSPRKRKRRPFATLIAFSALVGAFWSVRGGWTPSSSQQTRVTKRSSTVPVPTLPSAGPPRREWPNREIASGLTTWSPVARQRAEEAYVLYSDVLKTLETIRTEHLTAGKREDLRHYLRTKCWHAAQKARQAIAADPNYVKGYLYEVYALYLMDDPAAARQALHAALMRFPTDDDLLSARKTLAGVKAGRNRRAVPSPSV